ncbi:hypothetical protein OOK27_13110 [Streptomyces canus]|nr:hypothetical protein [Streptomyces canus]MCX5255077.1 hypothetical protein [Streptomyces canus]
MPLRLARYGVPLAETAPAGLAAAGIDEPPIAFTFTADRTPPAPTQGQEPELEATATAEQETEQGSRGAVHPELTTSPAQPERSLVRDQAGAETAEDRLRCRRPTRAGRHPVGQSLSFVPFPAPAVPGCSGVASATDEPSRPNHTTE